MRDRIIQRLRKITKDLDATVRDHAERMSPLECMEAAETMLADPHATLLFALGGHNRTDVLVSLAAASIAREACRKAEAKAMEDDA